MKAMTKQNNTIQIGSMQLTMPRARRRHFYNLRYSGYVTLLVSGSDKTKMGKKMTGVCCSRSARVVVLFSSTQSFADTSDIFVYQPL